MKGGWNRERNPWGFDARREAQVRSESKQNGGNLHRERKQGTEGFKRGRACVAGTGT